MIIFTNWTYSRAPRISWMHCNHTANKFAARFSWLTDCYFLELLTVLPFMWPQYPKTTVCITVNTTVVSNSLGGLHLIFQNGSRSKFFGDVKHVTTRTGWRTRANKFRVYALRSVLLNHSQIKISTKLGDYNSRVFIFSNQNKILSANVIFQWDICNWNAFS